MGKENIEQTLYTKYFIDDELNPDENIQLLNQMILSPSSYRKVEKKKKRLGCCINCRSGLRAMV